MFPFDDVILKGPALPVQTAAYTKQMMNPERLIKIVIK